MTRAAILCLGILFFLSCEQKKAEPAPSGQDSMRTLLDSRRRAKEWSHNKNFEPFMRMFYERNKVNDWKSMEELARREGDLKDYFDSLIGLATAASLRGVKSIDLPWDPRDELGADGYVRLGMCLLASAQGAREPEQAKLTPAQRQEVLLVWWTLYTYGLMTIGAEDDPLPPSPEEALNKITAATSIAMLLRDPTRASLGVWAAAWIMERMGDRDRSLKLRRSLDAEIVWPPVIKKDGRYEFALPDTSAQVK